MYKADNRIKYFKFKKENNYEYYLWERLACHSTYLCWSWITAFILAIPKLIDIYSTDYYLDNQAGVVVYKHGLINKRQENIDLYRIKNISSRENIFSGGYIYVTFTDRTVKTLPYIKNANEVSISLRNIANTKRVEQGVKPIEILK